MDLVDSNSRRSLRARTSSSVSGTAGPPTPTGSESPRSDVSDGRASRSSRLSNPEFAAKHKAFMAKVTAASKGSMDSYLSTELVSEEGLTPGGKRKATVKGGEDLALKRRRNTKQNSNGLDTLNDAYCWICHKEGEVICCETCPRVFHLKCIQLEASPAEDWVCPECVLIMTAENMDTRSRAMRLLTVDQLCTLLKHALARMKSVLNSEPFLKPVDPLQFPAYKDYISCPMDIQSMERNIRRKQYGSTEAMLADCKWILHNCIIFNSPASKLTNIAKNIVKVCKHEMQEIENCPDCYLNAHIKKDTWFTEACRFPHCLVWAKLKGFPYWPGKIMRVNSENNADIRFFGAHDRAWIGLKDVFLFSEKPPLDIKKKRGNLDEVLDGEVQTHIKKLRERFGEFVYAPHKTHFDYTKEEEMLKILFPKFVLPFEIGSLARRARSYSFTGSERSRGGTPTPSEASMQEEDEEELEEADEGEMEVDKNVESNTEISSPVVINVLAETLPESEEIEQSNQVDVQNEQESEEGDEVILKPESQEMFKIVNECESEGDEEKFFKTGSVDEETEEAQVEQETKVQEEEEAQLEEGEKVEEEEEEEQLEEKENIVENENNTIQDVPEETTGEESVDPANSVEMESVMVAEEVIEDSIDHSMEEVSDVGNEELENKKETSENVESATSLPATENVEHPTDITEETAAEICDDSVKPDDTPDEDSNEKAVAESSVDRSTISPPCEVTSTTATPGPTTIPESPALPASSKSTKDKIHGIIAETSEPVIVEDEDPSDEIDDVEPVHQSDEDDSNDVMEVEEEAVEECSVIEDESSSQAAPVNISEKQTGETSKAGTVTEEREEIDDVEPVDDSQKAKSSKQEETKAATVDPTKLLAAGVSITVIDKKKGTEGDSTAAAATAAEADLSSDISVTLVQKTKTDSSSGKFTLSLKRESELLDPEKTASMDRKSASRKSLTEETEKTPDPIVTISKIASMKESKEMITNNSSDSKKFQVSSSPGPGLRSPASSPSPGMMGHRLPGYRGPGPMGMPPGGPRGPMMNMGMMRGQFRGPMPPSGPHLPNLQPRPSGLMGAHPSLPSAAGPVAEQMNRVAGKLADYMRQNLEDLFKDLSQQGSPEATIKGLQLELEKMQWRHQQEMAEVKHNADLIMMEMRASMEQDKQRAIADCRKQAEIDKQKAIAETKKKQWCANCGKEAIFYCCWNTSYCDYPCQQSHWPVHMSSCAQNNSEQTEPETSEPEAVAPQHFLAGSSMMVANHGPPGRHPGHGHQPRHQNRGRPGPGVPSSMAGMRFNMQPRLPGHGHTSFTRPYFM